MVLDQMINTTAPVIASIAYGTVEYGFARYEGGRIFFLTPHGKETFPFPVLKDGTICRRGGEGIKFPNEIVELVHPKDLGLTKSFGPTDFSQVKRPAKFTGLLNLNV